MQLQFHKTMVPCLQRIKEDTQYLEQTQELRLPEGMPDIGSILGAWGQVLIRGKEWHSGSMSVTGGVMAWAMYQPEEQDEPQMVEAWIPFQMKCDLPETQYDGVIRVNPLLRGIDARNTSARKLMLRVGVGMLLEAVVPMEGEVYTPADVPEDIQLLQNTYPMQLPREAGEKAFTMDEDLTMPTSAPPVKKILRFSLQPELIDQKVMSGKVAFRGAGILHILYMGEDDQLHSWDLEVPFAQYAQLDTEYEQEAAATIWLAVTSLELDQDEQGTLHLKAGLTGQYQISDRSMIQVVEDAYSPWRKITVQMQPLSLPAILESAQHTIHAETVLDAAGRRGVDAAFYPDQTQLRRSGDRAEGELRGYFQILGYDPEGKLQGGAARWHSDWSVPACDACTVQMVIQPSGVPQFAGSDQIRADILAQTQTTALQGIPMVTGIETGEQTNKDSDRPSLILRKAGNDTLWELAKRSGSTVQAICEANHLTQEPVPDRILLIPVH